MTKKKIYLDVCALCRIYDDQNQLRVKLETDAVLMILDKIKLGSYEMITTSMHYIEIAEINEYEEQSNLQLFLKNYGTKVKTNKGEIKKLANNLIDEFKIGIADSIHIAFAEFSSDYFISCDDKLLQRMKKVNLKVKCMNPIEFLVTENLK